MANLTGGEQAHISELVIKEVEIQLRAFRDDRLKWERTAQEFLSDMDRILLQVRNIVDDAVEKLKRLEDDYGSVLHRLEDLEQELG